MDSWLLQQQAEQSFWDAFPDHSGSDSTCTTNFENFAETNQILGALHLPSGHSVSCGDLALGLSGSSSDPAPITFHQSAFQSTLPTGLSVFREPSLQHPVLLETPDSFLQGPALVQPSAIVPRKTPLAAASFEGSSLVPEWLFEEPVSQGDSAIFPLVAQPGPIPLPRPLDAPEPVFLEPSSLGTSAVGHAPASDCLGFLHGPTMLSQTGFMTPPTSSTGALTLRKRSLGPEFPSQDGRPSHKRLNAQDPNSFQVVATTRAVSSPVPSSASHRTENAGGSEIEHGAETAVASVVRPKSVSCVLCFLRKKKVCRQPSVRRGLTYQCHDGQPCPSCSKTPLSRSLCVRIRIADEAIFSKCTAL